MPAALQKAPRWSQVLVEPPGKKWLIISMANASCSLCNQLHFMYWSSISILTHGRTKHGIHNGQDGGKDYCGSETVFTASSCALRLLNSICQRLQVSTSNLHNITFRVRNSGLRVTTTKTQQGRTYLMNQLRAAPTSKQHADHKT